MKRSMGKRIAVFLMTLFITVPMLPIQAITESFTSDWFRLELQTKPAEITEDNADIRITLQAGDTVLTNQAVPDENSEEKEVPAIECGTQIHASVEVLFHTSLADEKASLSYVYRLPDCIVTDDTDWSEVLSGKWRIQKNVIELNYDSGARENDIRDALFEFAFTSEEKVIPFVGGTFTLPFREAKPAFLSADGEGFAVRLYPSSSGQIPEGAMVSAKEIADRSYYLQKAVEQLGITEKEIVFLRVFDLSIMDGDQEIQPASPVRVEMDLAAEGEKISVLHFHTAPDMALLQSELAPSLRSLLKSSSKQEQADILVAETAGNTIRFEADSFSAFAVVGYTLEKRVLAGDGNLYLITVSYGSDAGIPEGAALEVSEILLENEFADEPAEYERYKEQAALALGLESGAVGYARFFDISIVDASGQHVQPAEGSTVSVSIRLEDVESGTLKVVHFGKTAEVLNAVIEGNSVSFDAAGFSVYGIVDAPEPVSFDPYKLGSVEEIEESKAYLLSYGSPEKYFTSVLNNNNCLTETTAFDQAARWYFDIDEENQTFYIYTMADEQKRYIQQKSTGSNEIMLSAQGTAFSLSKAGPNKFYFKHASQNRWLQHSNSGRGIRLYTDNDNAANSSILITVPQTDPPESDPYGLDGKTYGIAYHDESVTAAALTAESKTVSGQSRLADKDMVMRPDVLDNDGILLVSNNSDITEWSFEWVEKDQYHITATVNREKKYLTINGANVTLADAPDETMSLITARPGTGTQEGKWHFTVNNYSLNLPSGSGNGFNAANNSGATTWMNLVEKSVLEEDDFTLYSARKVSVSDNANVYNGQKVILYTRVWNDAAKRYDFYAVDHDGSLVRCYDNGDGVEWLGTRVNTALWELTIYYDADGTENYYYELKNTQYPVYIAPQVAEDQILSDSPVGINLNGRRYGENYTTVIAWDDTDYAFAGLKAENGRAVPCALAEADDFYFAVMNPAESEELSTVRTIDGTQYGITMKMVNFNNPKINPGDSPRDSVQNPFFGGDNNNAGLLSTDLQNGYPVTTSVTGNAGHPLSDLFTGMQNVNHLFIQSIHNESGYFEYDSTSNFARLNPDGNFTVYDQLGAIGNYGTVTGTHGQFMPYNDLTPGKYCSFTNQTNVLAKELADTNARKGERLYDIGKRSEVDYHFGMEMSASFTQTADGLDAWGHDIIFEFSGDDDFWFYVDGELVLDLGGVHSAMTGSINFRTGEVKSTRGNSTLYEIFKKNYQTRGLPEEEIDEKLASIFTQNEKGQYVFTNYSNHDMRMFYMERGAGASNLHMRFNLAAVKPGSFILSKKLSGTDHPANDLIEFPYQIIYRSKKDSEWHLLGENPGDAEQVFYTDSTRRVKYAESFTPPGGNVPYSHVFFLKPGESAEVNMPEDTVQYYVVECGVNPDVYNVVKANETQLSGTETGNQGRKDYKVLPDTLENRPKIDFDNHVKQGAMRTLEIVKKLYDVDGNTVLYYPANKTLFSFRLYLGTENDSPDNLPYANLYSYYIKDRNGHYCRWDAAKQEFDSLTIADYSTLFDYLKTLPSAQRETIEFITSQNGTISKIPAGYTVEVRNLIVGTQYKVEEREAEIPRGYTLRIDDGYTRVDQSSEIPCGNTPVTDTIKSNENPKYEVRNQRGWGLTVKKVWTDADFMLSHDPIYFAVYLNDTLLQDKIWQMRTSDDEVYFFFDDLKDSDGQSHGFDEFTIYEVELENPVVDENGKVTEYSSIKKINQDESLVAGGIPSGKTEREDFPYKVDYQKGESTGHNENVRIDTVTNSRPGIELYKTDWTGSNLSGAVFTLTDENGLDVSAPKYTSDINGLITTAYLANGTYTLTEIGTPKGYTALDGPVTITVNGQQVTVSPESGLYKLVSDSSGKMLARITIKNRPVSFRVRKVGVNNVPLQGVSFALYRQVTDEQGNKRKDYLPIKGYENLVTGEGGILEKVTMDLRAGTYYLTETDTLGDYVLLSDDICFTIGADGTVVVEDEQFKRWLTKTVDGVTGTVSYEITIPNGPPEPASVAVSGRKVLRGKDMEADEFTFTLKQIDVDGKTVPGGASLTASNVSGAAGEETVFTFAPLQFSMEDYRNAAYHDTDGNALFYYLVEERIPEGAEGNLKDGILYSTDKFLVVVTVTYSNGQLYASLKAYIYDGTGVPAHLRPVFTTI